MKTKALFIYIIMIILLPIVMAESKTSNNGIISQDDIAIKVLFTYAGGMIDASQLPTWNWESSGNIKTGTVDSSDYTFTSEIKEIGDYSNKLSNTFLNKNKNMKDTYIHYVITGPFVHPGKITTDKLRDMHILFNAIVIDFTDVFDYYPMVNFSGYLPDNAAVVSFKVGDVAVGKMIKVDPVIASLTFNNINQTFYNITRYNNTGGPYTTKARLFLNDFGINDSIYFSITNAVSNYYNGMNDFNISLNVTVQATAINCTWEVNALNATGGTAVWVPIWSYTDNTNCLQQNGTVLFNPHIYNNFGYILSAMRMRITGVNNPINGGQLVTAYRGDDVLYIPTEANVSFEDLYDTSQSKGWDAVGKFEEIYETSYRVKSYIRMTGGGLNLYAGHADFFVQWVGAPVLVFSGTGTVYLGHISNNGYTYDPGTITFGASSAYQTFDMSSMTFYGYSCSITGMRGGAGIIIGNSGDIQRCTFDADDQCYMQAIPNRDVYLYSASLWRVTNASYYDLKIGAPAVLKGLYTVDLSTPAKFYNFSGSVFRNRGDVWEFYDSAEPEITVDVLYNWGDVYDYKSIVMRVINNTGQSLVNATIRIDRKWGAAQVGNLTTNADGYTNMSYFLMKSWVLLSGVFNRTDYGPFNLTVNYPGCAEVKFIDYNITENILPFPAVVMNCSPTTSGGITTSCGISTPRRKSYDWIT